VVFPELCGSVFAADPLQDLLSARVIILQLTYCARLLERFGGRDAIVPTFVTSYTSPSTMIHSESGFLCSATSVALSIFDMTTVNGNNNKQRV